MYYMKKGNIPEKAAFKIIAQKADGSLRDTLSIFDQAVNFSNGNISYDTIIENLNIIDLNTSSK